MDNQDPLSIDLQNHTQVIIKLMHFQPYHFIELFIYFNNFIEEDAIGKENFITANTTILNTEEDDDEVLKLSKEIFSILSPSNYATIIALCCYLRKISISASPDLDVDMLFSILDKDNKGHIEYLDIETLISSFEDFIGEMGNWEVYKNSFSGKKIIKRNLTQNHFYDELKLLFNKAHKIIDEKLLAAKKAIELHQHAITKLSMPNIQGVATVHSKNSSPASNSKKSDNTTMKIIDSNKEKTEISQKDNKENEQSLITASPANSYSINNNNNDAGQNDIGIDDILFDKRKLEIIAKIKRTTYLYDIPIEDFVNEFIQYEDAFFDKQTFITTINDIICKNTSDLFQQPMKKLALSMLYQIIDYDHKNHISFYEVIGGIIPLLKAREDYDKIKIMFKYPKDKVLLLLSGTMSIYLNTDKIKDITIFSEIILENWKENNINNIQDLFLWIYKDTAQESKLQYNSYVLHTEIPVSPNDNEVTDLLNTIQQKFTSLKQSYHNEINSLSILDITTKILKYSFLGVINNFQIANMLDSLFTEKFASLPEKQRNRLKMECYRIIEKNFDFGQTELIDVTHLHAFSMLVFSGRTIERFQSVFLIYDLGENDPIEYDDLCDYLRYLFDFALKETNITWCNGKSLAKIICDYIVRSIDKKITLTCLTQAYDSLVNVFLKQSK